MTTDFSYGGKQILAGGPIKPGGKDMPLDARTRINTYSEKETIPNPFIGMIVTVLTDEKNNNKMTDYKVKSLKANSAGMVNMVIDEMIPYVDYLGVSSSGGGSSSGGAGVEIVNDLTTGGANKALSAEQGKVIKASLDTINTTMQDIGTETLPTTAQTIKGAIAETFQNVSSGKTLIARAITDKGVPTSNTDSFQQMATNIGSISSDVVKDPYRENRVLIWEDDFDGNVLNTNNWRYSTGYIRNEELQYYTNSSKNVYLENSNLVFKAIKEQVNGYKNGVATVFDWTSGCIETAKKKEFQYGRFEAKMKIPQTLGSFPAFWTLGHT